MTIESYQDLNVWKKSMGLSVRIYELTKDFPPEEQYGLVKQLRRSVVSLPSNIAEGWGRGPSKEFTHFLKIARGSLYELETQMILAQMIGYVNIEKLDDIRDHITMIAKMLLSLIRSIENK